MKLKRSIITILSISCLMNSFSLPQVAAGATIDFENSINNGIEYITDNYDNIQKELYLADINNIFEYISFIGNNENTSNLSDSSLLYFYEYQFNNVDELSKYLLNNRLHETAYINFLLKEQNPDGGFGLAEGYASDIIDTKLALKALDRKSVV